MSTPKVVTTCRPYDHRYLRELAPRKAMTPAYHTGNVDHEPIFEKHDAPFVVIHDSFKAIIGSHPTLEIIASSEKKLGGDGRAFAHEAGVYMHQYGQVWFTSNLYREGEHGFRNQISNIIPEEPEEASELTSIWDDVDIPYPHPAPLTANGATNFSDFLLFCDQGIKDVEPSRLILLNVEYGETEIILNNYYGRAFNSINDVAVLPPRAGMTTDMRDQHHHRDTTIWFTDPCYGYYQAYKEKPELPSQVYCFNRTTGEVRAVADGFTEPNGICFNYQGTKCYVTDTGVVQGDGKGGWNMDGARPSSIYEFDVVRPDDPSKSLPRLANRRLFAFVSEGVPDGIKCDQAGNVYSGCGDGVHVWNEYGTLIGKICLLPDEVAPDTKPETLSQERYRSRHCANFCFLPDSRLFILAEDRIYIAQLDRSVKGAL